ncbi:DUF6356 family protein [Sphingomonas arantia]|uniref:DUF6356 family protein n=1 Tax=Sphingomonas arantia TaxID=1460676 RepID=A0ABW4TW29_9SPHN
MRHLFTDHPHAVGETYLEHLRTAAWFAGTMLLAGTACLIHALFPALFVRTGSEAIARLHDRMVVNRTRVPAVRD